MLVLGLLDAVLGITTAILCGFAYTEAIQRGGDWAGLTKLVALLAGVAAVVLGLLALGLFIARVYVRRGTPRGLQLGLVVTSLAGALPAGPLCLVLAGNAPQPLQLVLGALVLALWLGPHFWIITQLRRALREPRSPNEECPRLWNTHDGPPPH